MLASLLQSLGTQRGFLSPTAVEAEGSGLETSLVQPLLFFCFSVARAALMATEDDHVLQLPCLWNESWEVSYISSQGHGHLEHCLFQLLAAA